MRSIFFSLLFSFVVTFGFTASAQEAAQKTVTWNPSAAQEKIQQNPFLKQLLASGVDLHSIGNEQGFDGWLLTKDGQIQILYSHPESDALLTGMLIGAAGENLTALQLARYEAISGNSLQDDLENTVKSIEGLKKKTPSEILFLEAGQLDWLGYGSSNNKQAYLYAFVNVSSPKARGYFERLLTIYAKEDLIQVRAIPTYSNEADREAVLKIYSAETPAQMLLAYMSGDNDALNAVEVNDAMAVRLDKTASFLSKLKMDVVENSLTFYRGDNKTIKLVKDTPKDLQAIVLEITIQ